MNLPSRRPLQSQSQVPHLKGLRGLRLFQGCQQPHPLPPGQPVLLASSPSRRPDPFGYANKWIVRNGDVGRVEYLLLSADSRSHRILSCFSDTPSKFCSAMKEYVSAMRSMACYILEPMADGLMIQPKNMLSKLLMDEQSDPPCPDNDEGKLIGFGEHTDPQIISVRRSNNASGLQISLKDGIWISGSRLLHKCRRFPAGWFWYMVDDSNLLI